MTRDGLLMTDRLLTISDRPGPPPGLFDLLVLERALCERVDDLDGRIDELLLTGDPADDRTVGDIDVLCAALGEAQELLAEARREAALHAAVRRSRRARPRRWT
jgi:hypothetical protein